MTKTLGMAAFEAYMRADDRPDHPMTALLEVSFTGQLDRDALESALTHVLRHHPLLQATIDDVAKRPRWIVHDDVRPFFDWADESAPLTYPGGIEAIDLTREIGLRIWVREGVADGRIVLQLHHACTDGVGVLQFLGDLLRAYDAFSRGDVPHIPRDTTRLATRDQFFDRPFWGRTKALLSAASHSRKWTRSRPMPIHDRSPPSDGISLPMASILHRELDAAETSDLLDAARAAGVTINDLLIRDLFQVLVTRCGDASVDSNDCLCICMPMNLRDADDARMPAANKMMMSFLRRTPWECSEPTQLLRSVHEETTFIKRTRRGVRMLEVLRIAMALTGRVPQKLLAKNSFATAVLSNLGRLTSRDVGLPEDDEGRLVTGGLTIDRIVTAPNGRPGTAAVIVALTYARRLTLSLRYERDTLSEKSAEELLEEYLVQLRETAVSRQPEPVLA